MAAGKSGIFGKLVGSSAKGSFDPTARRSRVPGCSKAAAIAASSVATLACPVANRFRCVPHARSAAAWLGAATTVSKQPNSAWKTFSFRVGFFGKIPKLHLRLAVAVSRLGWVHLISISIGWHRVDVGIPLQNRYLMIARRIHEGMPQGRLRVHFSGKQTSQ